MPKPVVQVTPLEDSQILEPVVQKSAFSRSDLINAAQLWINQAYFAPIPEQQDLLLRSTAALIRAGRLSESKKILAGIEVSGLPPLYPQRKRLLRAQLALAEGRADLAVRYLAGFGGMQGIEPEFKAVVLAIRAQAYEAENETSRALRDLIEREPYLNNEIEIRQNRQNIWALAAILNNIELQIERQTAEEGSALADWLDLALLYIDFGMDPHRLQQTLTDWARLNPSGSAQLFASELIQMPGGTMNAPNTTVRKMALLLPLASRYSQAAQSVHDGFMAMRALDSNPLKPDIVVYDVGEIPDLAASYYRLAIEEGSNLIVGPLGKQAATAVVNSQQSQVPTLMLGGVQQGRGLPPGTYLIDLAPEDEAAQVATRAHLDGYRVAGLLRPNTEWGQRVAQAFTERWESLGGIMVDAQIYEENSNDHSFAIKEILNINASQGRKSALSATLNSPLEFQPRRRQDLEMLFLVSRTVAGRLIKPQINFFQGHDIPVYSTSHIYSGSPDKINDADLNQVIFGDMPWLLHNDSRASLLRTTVQSRNRNPGGLDRLFALGIDAYLLSRVVPYLQPEYTFALKGATAETLAIGTNRQVERQLAWARFENGAPLLLKPMDGSDGYENIEPDQMEQISRTPVTRPTGGTTSVPVFD